MKKALPIIIIILIIVGFGVAWKLMKKEASLPISKADLIRIDSPRPNQIIQSPLTITGEARGSWFFEASFPVVLTNWDGLIIAQGIATAKSDPSHEDGAGWMTADFVPFEAKLTFTVDKNSYSNKGTLIFRKDNPSGLPEHDDALEIPVVFAGVTGPPYNSGVRGTVLLGPICPVMREPPDPNCADKPYATTVQVIAIGSPKSSPFATVETDKEGRYKVMLPPGEYGLQAIGGAPFPSCGTQNITIEPDVILEIDLSCDTGIR